MLILIAIANVYVCFENDKAQKELENGQLRLQALLKDSEVKLLGLIKQGRAGEIDRSEILNGVQSVYEELSKQGKLIILIEGPRGPQGVKGDTGAKGPVGQKGEKGDSGGSAKTLPPPFYAPISC